MCAYWFASLGIPHQTTFPVRTNVARQWPTDLTPRPFQRCARAILEPCRATECSGADHPRADSGGANAPSVTFWIDKDRKLPGVKEGFEQNTHPAALARARAREKRDPLRDEVNRQIQVVGEYLNAWTLLSFRLVGYFVVDSFLSCRDKGLSKSPFSQLSIQSIQQLFTRYQ